MMIMKMLLFSHIVRQFVMQIFTFYHKIGYIRMKSSKTIILVLSLLFVCVLGQYGYRTKLTLDDNYPRSFALAPELTIDYSGSSYDMVVGFGNGAIQMINTNGTYSSRDYRDLAMGSINFVEWNNAGICAASIQKVILLDPRSMKLKQQITSATENIYGVACGVRQLQFGQTYVTAIALHNQIDIFENAKLVMSIPINFTVQYHLTMDSTAKYLYYCDGVTRYVVDMYGRKMYTKYALPYTLKRIAAAKDKGHTDVTASTSALGMAVWTDYFLQNMYNSTTVLYIDLEFNQDDTILAIYNKNTTSVELWKTNFPDYSSWSVSQNIRLNDSDLDGLDCQNNMVAFLSGRSIYIYNNNGQSNTKMIIIIVCSVVGVIVIVVAIVCIVRRRKAKQNNGEYANLDNQSSSQGFNNNTAANASLQAYPNNYDTAGSPNQNNWGENQNNNGWGAQNQNQGFSK